MLRGGRGGEGMYLPESNKALKLSAEETLQLSFSTALREFVKNDIWN